MRSVSRPSFRQAWLTFCCAVAALGAASAGATEIQDLVRIKGHEKNTLTGLGLVIGLDGTGDQGRDALVAARPMAQLLRNLGNSVGSIEELAEADAFAIVQVTMVIPPTGGREGDEIDVYVDSLFNASSLEGGRLVPSMLRLPLPDSAELPPLAMAQGRVIIEGANPRSGVVRSGGQLFEQPGFDLRANVLAPDGSMTLILHDRYASHTVATVVADAINDTFVPPGYPDIAVAEDAKNIRVRVPQVERERGEGGTVGGAATFIATVMTIQIDPSLIRTPARVVVNEQIGSIAITGNVEISPVAITHDGLSITTISPPPVATEDAPVLEFSDWATLDTTRRGLRDSARLEDLVRAFEQLNIPAKDRIAILYQLRDAGALHAEIIRQ